MDNFGKFNYIFFDLETTALDIFEARILEIAACYPQGDQFFHEYVKYPLKITNSNIHGITQEVLAKNNAQLLVTVLTKFVKWVEMKFDSSGGNIYLVAYNNLGYDKPVLEMNFKRVGMKIPENWYFMDPYPQIKELYPTNDKLKNLKLTTLYKYFFNRELIGAHGALADTKALYEVYLKVVQDNFFDMNKITSQIKNILPTYSEVFLPNNAFMGCYIAYISYMHKSSDFIQPTIFHPNAIFQKIETLGIKGYQLKVLQEEGFDELKDLLIFYLVVYPNFGEALKKRKHHGQYFASKSANYLINKLENSMKYYAHVLYGLNDSSSDSDLAIMRHKIKILN